MEEVPPVPILTKREAEVLAILQAADAELVYEKGTAYVGHQRVGGKVVNMLLFKMCVSQSAGELGGYEVYQINETGRKALYQHWGLEEETR
jgi:hypothetical protein